MKAAFAVMIMGACLVAGGSSSLHVSGVASPPARALLKVGPEEPAVEIEISEGFLGKAFPVSAAQEAELTLLGDDGSRLPGPLRFRTADEGRHLLLVSPGLDNRARLSLLPVDHLRHPMGGATFLNLSDNFLRCWIGSKAVEVGPGKSALHPSISTARRIANHRVEYLDAGGAWRHESSSTLIFARSSRFILTIGPGRAEVGPLPRHTVMDTEATQQREDFTSTVQPPPQGQPAK